jgi:hypothetical protein
MRCFENTWKLETHSYGIINHHEIDSPQDGIEPAEFWFLIGAESGVYQQDRKRPRYARRAEAKDIMAHGVLGGSYGVFEAQPRRGRPSKTKTGVFYSIDAIREIQ